MDALRLSLASLFAVSTACGLQAQAQQLSGDRGQLALEEVLVTAQRRAERLVDVPLSVTVVNENLLHRSGVSNASDLERLVPGLAMPKFGGFVQPSIRGISSQGSNPGDQSNVATYIDGVYMPSQSSQLYDLSDVESIEVLKGPQGSLYGQNAAGGAIIIKTKSPTFEPTGSVALSYGNLDDKDVHGFISAPLSSTVAVSLSAKYQERDGYNKDIFTGRKDDGLESSLARGKLLWKPNDTAELLFTAYWFDQKDSSAFTTQPFKGNALAYQLNPTGARPSSAWQFANNTAFGRYPTSRLTGYGLNLQGTFDIGAGELRFITAYSDASPKHWVDLDATSEPLLSFEYLIPVPVKSITQEITFASRQLGNWRYTTGLFYMNSKERFDDLRIVISGLDLLDPMSPPTMASVQSGTNTKNSAAVFGEVEYSIDEHWSIIGGLRYSYETQLGSFSETFAFDGTREPASDPEVTNPDGTVSFKKTTPRLSIRYAIDDGNNVYATISQGFKSGIVDVQNLARPPVRPEEVTAYEIGYKGSLLDRRLRIDTSVFRYDYKDLQVQINLGNGAYGYQNAGKAQISGFEAGMQLEAMRDLQLGLSVSYLDTEYKKYDNASIYLPIPGGGNLSTTENVAGNRLTRAPKWSGQLSGNYERDFSWGEMSLYAGLHYSDGYYFDPENLRKQTSHSLLDARLSYSPLNSNLSVALWGANLTDKAVERGMLTTNFGSAVSYGAPRTYGIEFGYKY